MPELPEVQTVVDDLKRSAFVGKKIVRAELFWDRCVIKPSPSDFQQGIAGQIVVGITRRGKWIVVGLQKFTLLIHLRMSGRLIISKDIAPTLHERIRFCLDDGRVLRFEDQRKFGTIHLLVDPLEVIGNLGVEPLSEFFTTGYLMEVLKQKRTKIKAQLLDQSFIAGLGNIYVDEALWLARIHPESPSNLLEKGELEQLHKAIQEVLILGISNKGTSLGEGKSNFHGASGQYGRNLTHLHVYKRKGLPCSRCNRAIEKITSAGRGTHFCRFCQTSVKVP